MSLSSSPTHPVRRALISVSDKDGLVDLGRALAAQDVQIFSTGSTAASLAGAGVPVREVSSLTGFPECLDGRVKTLHPAVHGGILADQGSADHQRQLRELGIEPFDLVVVNLYPFGQTVASGASFEECVEMIDIGGPTMVRAAAKNHASVAILTDPSQYGELLQALEAGGTTREQRQLWALEAFRHTATYDVSVATWLGQQVEEQSLPGWFGRTYQLKDSLRYGENPHQAAALYSQSAPAPRFGSLTDAKQLGGKEMSYNNYQDTEAALRAAYDQQDPAVAIIKHANPCGIATAKTVAEAYQLAFACDPLSAFGSVVAVNRQVDGALAEEISRVFTEVVAAPSYTQSALEILQKKANLRLLEIEQSGVSDLEFTPIGGGALVQEPDLLDAVATHRDGSAAGDDVENWKLVAGRPASEAVLADLDFAWRAVRSVKSNAILIARGGASVGVGMGQVNRVDSAKLAVERANTLDGGVKRTEGAVAASDAFFPFADGLQILIEAGVTAVVAPGGSMRDDQVIECAKQAGITLYFTGVRHFWH